MKLDRKKYEPARARACMRQKDLVAAEFQGVHCVRQQGARSFAQRRLGRLQKLSVLM